MKSKTITTDGDLPVYEIENDYNDGDLLVYEIVTKWELTELFQPMVSQKNKRDGAISSVWFRKKIKETLLCPAYGIVKSIRNRLWNRSCIIANNDISADEIVKI